MRHIVYALVLLLRHVAAMQAYSSELDITLAEALSQIIIESEMSYSHTLDIHVQHSGRETLQQLLDLLEQLVWKLDGSQQPRRLYYQRNLRYKPYKHAAVLLVDDLNALRQLYSSLRATSNLTYMLIYMLQPSPKQVMQLMWRRSVLNVALIMLPQQDVNYRTFELLSYYPYADHGCQLIHATVVNHFVRAVGRWDRTVYFPSKMRNFYGCTLTCATWPDMPYLVQRRDGEFVGIEGSLLQFMANNLNFSVSMYWLNQTQVRDTFNESGWIFQQIFSAADFSLGGFHNRPSDGGNAVHYSQSTYYFMSHIMLVTNLPSAYSPYERLAFPFHPYLWRAIGAALLSACVVTWLIQCWWKQMPKHPYYSILVSSMGGSLLVTELPSRNPCRVLLVTWLLWTFVIRNAYQSGMYYMLRQDTQRNPPQTIDDVLQQNYIIQLVDGNVDRWLASLPELRNQELRHLEASELQSFGALAASSGSNQRLAIITPYEYFGYFRKVHAMSRRLHVVRERIFTQQLSFNVRWHSHLVDMLNRQISDAHTYGFLEHWTRQYVSAVDERDESVTHIPSIWYSTLDGHSPDGYTNVALDVTESEHILVLSLKELGALFWIILWAYLIALTVFGIELLLRGHPFKKLFIKT